MKDFYIVTEGWFYAMKGGTSLAYSHVLESTVCRPWGTHVCTHNKSSFLTILTYISTDRKKIPLLSIFPLCSGWHQGPDGCTHACLSSTCTGASGVGRTHLPQAPFSRAMASSPPLSSAQTLRKAVLNRTHILYPTWREQRPCQVPCCQQRPTITPPVTRGTSFTNPSRGASEHSSVFLQYEVARGPAYHVLVSCLWSAMNHVLLTSSEACTMLPHWPHATRRPAHFSHSQLSYAHTVFYTQVKVWERSTSDHPTKFLS